MPSRLFGSRNPVKPHLTAGGGLAREVADLRSDIEGALNQLESQGGYLRTDEFTNPAAADVDAIKTSIASAASIQTYSGAALNGVVGATEMVPPRNPTVTTTLHADIDAVVVVFAGKVRDAAGDLVARSVSVTLTDGGGTTDAAVDVLSVVESITVPAQSGAGGALEFGFGARIGLGAKIKSRAGLLAPLREVEVGAVVTTGAFATASGAPCTTYTPATAPNAARDYAVTYEVDPS